MRPPVAAADTSLRFEGADGRPTQRSRTGSEGEGDTAGEVVAIPGDEPAGVGAGPCPEVHAASQATRTGTSHDLTRAGRDRVMSVPVELPEPVVGDPEEVGDLVDDRVADHPL